MSEMVDKVAAAIYEHELQTYPESAAAKKEFFIDSIYHDAVRIALKAMREPTEEMVKAAWADALAEDAKGVWCAMIDAALS